MALTFKSRAGTDVTMLDANAKQVLELIGKEMSVRGVITAAEAPACIAKLKAAIGAQGDEARPDERAEPERAAAFVSLKTRLWPFIDMLERAQANGTDVLWGV
jgi:Domain of unknown function (DUF1840)